MKKWLANFIQVSLRENFADIHDRLESIEEIVKETVDIIGIERRMRQEQYDDNLRRLSTMANELKGTIAMARSGIKKKA